MKAVVVGSGAGGAVAARELQIRGFEVTVLEAGAPFRPFTRRLSWAEPLRRSGVLGEGEIFERLFPALKMRRSSPELILVRGLTVGGSTVLSCGNLVRTDRGLSEIGLNLSPEFDELEAELCPCPVPEEKWSGVTRELFYAAEKLGLNPRATPKAIDLNRCNRCGLCELGCARGARWDAGRFLAQAIDRGSLLRSGTAVAKVAVEKNRVTGVVTDSGEIIGSDVVVLAAGGIGTAQILANSGYKTADRLWADIVVTLAGIRQNSSQLCEPPMAWYAQHEGYILSPYPDILSHYFHKPWRRTRIEDRVGIMVKLADMENGRVGADGNVVKSLTEQDRLRLEAALGQAREVMVKAGIAAPYLTGVANAGHLGGTVPLERTTAASLRPAGLADGLWVADLSLVPRSQGMPTILLTAALALRVARKIV
ncbi:GMC family oxidoreductase [candidate division KSB1 bacterium]|nr:GMC family oxidoreductase [candidate division KSB1 bacterium]